MAKLIWVAGGKKLAPGQIGLCEEHPDHPADDTGTHMGFVAKDDPVFGRALVAATPEVGRKLALGELVQIAEPETVAPATFAPSTGARTRRKSAKATKPEETQTADEIAAAEAAAAALAAAESGVDLQTDPGDDPDDDEDE